jgi:hypothetical protein
MMVDIPSFVTWKSFWVMRINVVLESCIHTGYPDVGPGR